MKTCDVRPNRDEKYLNPREQEINPADRCLVLYLVVKHQLNDAFNHVAAYVQSNPKLLIILINDADQQGWKRLETEYMIKPHSWVLRCPSVYFIHDVSSRAKGLLPTIVMVISWR